MAIENPQNCFNFSFFSLFGKFCQLKKAITHTHTQIEILQVWGQLQLQYKMEEQFHYRRMRHLEQQSHGQRRVSF